MEMEPVGVADGVDAGSDMKRESKSDAEVQGLRPRWMLVPLTMTGETRGRPAGGAVARSSVLAMLSLRCLLEPPPQKNTE